MKEKKDKGDPCLALDAYRFFTWGYQFLALMSGEVRE